jgi:subtilase family serine protease
MRTVTLILVLLAQLPVNAVAATCAGADPAITSVKVTNTASDGSLNRYTLVGTVTNLGGRKQASNVLQFVDIYQAGDRVTNRGIPPLAPGQSHTFSYVWQRAADAGNGTTTLRFNIRMTQPVPPGNQDCDLTNDAYHIRF